jgi:hypothetical protein
MYCVRRWVIPERAGFNSLPSLHASERLQHAPWTNLLPIVVQAELLPRGILSKLCEQQQLLTLQAREVYEPSRRFRLPVLPRCLVSDRLWRDIMRSLQPWLLPKYLRLHILQPVRKRFIRQRLRQVALFLVLVGDISVLLRLNGVRALQSRLVSELNRHHLLLHSVRPWQIHNQPGQRLLLVMLDGDVSERLGIIGVQTLRPWLLPRKHRLKQLLILQSWDVFK